MESQDLANTLAVIEHLADVLRVLAEGRETDRFDRLHRQVQGLWGLVERLVKVEQEEHLQLYERKKANAQILAEQRAHLMRDAHNAAARRRSDRLQSTARAVRLAR